MTMQAWTTHDGDGHEILVRVGTGQVTAVVPVGEPHESVVVYRVEIAVTSAAGRSRAVRVSAHALVAADDPLALIALDAHDAGTPVRWEIDWHRHAWVPGHLPIGSLNLVSDARASLRALEPLAVDAESTTMDSAVTQSWEA